MSKEVMKRIYEHFFLKLEIEKTSKSTLVGHGEPINILHWPFQTEGLLEQCSEKCTNPKHF